MIKAILVQITVFEGDDTDRTNAVVAQHVHTYTGSYGYEVEQMFQKFGERYAKIVDPYHDND